MTTINPWTKAKHLQGVHRFNFHVSEDEFGYPFAEAIADDVAGRYVKYCEVEEIVLQLEAKIEKLERDREILMTTTRRVQQLHSK